jgi:TPR repeat protein
MSITTDDSKQFSVGTQCMIKDLTSETGKKFNGKTCVIVSTFDVTTGRVGVRIKNARNKGRTLNIKPINLHADQTTTLMEGVKETKPQEAEDKEDCSQEDEDKEDCPICQDVLPRFQFVRMTCCGKAMHTKCRADIWASKMTNKLKNTCIMCRTPKVSNVSKEDIARLRGWVKKGKTWAMCMLASRYRDGVGVKQSDKKTIELFEMAAKRGNASAQYHLGLYYDQGLRGLTQSSKNAFEYYTLAAEQGYADAQCNLGSMYVRGDGVAQSDKKAIELYEMAAKRGNASSQHNLGTCYNHGLHGVTQSSEKAIEYYTLAAEQGSPEAQSNLGNIYYLGKGIETSYSKAREWWTKAAAQGIEQAIQNLKIIDKHEREKSTSTPPPKVVDPTINSCSTCGKQQTKEFRLGKCACRTKRYCNSQCQKKQYKQHKKECLRLVKERKKKKNGENMKDETTKDGKKEKARPLQEEEDKEDCPICTDALPKLSDQFVRLTCCGKGLHKKCAKDLMENTSMTLEQINTCIMCRAKLVNALGSVEEIKRLRKWAKKGEAWAMSMLASRYRDGVGVKQSDKKTIELYEMAAKRGNASAQYHLGLYYDRGRHGLTQSPERAIEYYTLAADQVHADAQYGLGRMYATGQCIEQSYSKARELWTKAAAQGNENAITALKMLDEQGV